MPFEIISLRRFARFFTLFFDFFAISARSLARYAGLTLPFLSKMGTPYADLPSRVWNFWRKAPKPYDCSWRFFVPG